jgi:hypothetical protein
MFIEGARGLMGAAGLPSLAPSIVTIVRILKATGENNAKIDQEAAQSLRDLFLKTGEMAGDLNKVIDQSLEQTFQSAGDRSHTAILGALSAIDQLENLEKSDKARIMETAIKQNIAARLEEINAAADIKKILAAGGAASLVLLAGAIVYKYSRKPTFTESLQKMISV